MARSAERAQKTLAKYALVLSRVKQLADQSSLELISEIDARFLDRYRSLRIKQGLQRKTVYTESTIIKQLVKFAHSRKLCQGNELAGYRLTKPKPTPQPCWSPEEVEQILKLCNGQQQRIFAVLADTGMRIGELKHLTQADVDLSRNVLHIREKEHWKPKSGDQRAVPMTPRVREIVLSQPKNSQWLFTAPSSQKYPQGGRQVSERRLLVYLKIRLRKLNLKGHLHTFRHSFISLAITRKTLEAIVRSWVGHVDLEITKLDTPIADENSQQAMQELFHPTKKADSAQESA